MKEEKLFQEKEGLPRRHLFGFGNLADSRNRTALQAKPGNPSPFIAPVKIVLPAKKKKSSILFQEKRLISMVWEKKSWNN